MLIRISLFLIMISCSASAIGQGIIEMQCDDPLDDATFVRVDERHFYMIQVSDPEDKFRGAYQLSISLYDDCGIVDAWTYTHEYVWGILDLGTCWIDGDMLRIPMMVNPRDVHSYREIGLFSFDIQNFATRYQYIRADNDAYLLSIFQNDQGQYVAWCFFSYTDRPAVYGALILDRDFDIQHQYVNLNEFTIAGDLIKVPDGYMGNSASLLIQFDEALNPIWSRQVETRHLLRKKILLDDGVVMLRTHFPFQQPIEQNVIKVDLSGNILWESNDIMPEESGFSRSELILERDGSLMATVFTWEGSDNYTDTLYQYQIDPNTGSIDQIATSRDVGVIPAFKYIDIRSEESGGSKLLVQSADDRQYLWTLADDSNCSLIRVNRDLPSATPLVLEDVGTLSSLDDAFITGEYRWDFIDLDYATDLICLQEDHFEDLLPDEIIACEEEPYYLDIRAVDRAIIWEDGDTSKYRQVSGEGAYTYRIDHCSIDFSERIEVAFQPCDCRVILPNIIDRSASNGDNTMSLNGQCRDLLSFKLQIMDRWGALVYETDDTDFTWTGTRDGVPVASGVYVYQVIFLTPDGEAPIVRCGDVLVMD